MKTKIVGVTGATGFIGGAICIELKLRGFIVLGLDLVSRKHLMPFMDDFYQDDFCNIPNYNMWNECDAIIHCAGTSLVGPSVKFPRKYYDNNVGKTIKLLDWCVENDKHFMFSSSASVYKTQNRAIIEEDDINPISPYAKSKRMVEEIVNDLNRADNLKATIFRYFNACGAIDEIHGQPPGSSHIFPVLFESKDEFPLNGTNFNTKDGTCIRDYIHIQDIARAHIQAMELNCYGIYNLGSSHGYSNLEIIKAVNKPYRDVGRRFGDSDCLIADNTLAKVMLRWTPSYTLNSIVDSLKKWYSSDNYKRMCNENLGN